MKWINQSFEMRGNGKKDAGFRRPAIVIAFRLAIIKVGQVIHNLGVRLSICLLNSIITTYKFMFKLSCGK